MRGSEVEPIRKWSPHCIGKMGNEPIDRMVYHSIVKKIIFWTWYIIKTHKMFYFKTFREDYF